MKTLVIHPEDPTTKFLEATYAGMECTVITDPLISKSLLRKAIRGHDRVIMMGHGTEHGLVSINRAKSDPSFILSHRFIIDSNIVNFLREVECVFIWCNADEFVNKYKLSGFHTGMIISEYEEALQIGRAHV